jgi:peptidoglycan/LPS O-acetylase OafA/YrhL
VPLVYSPDRVRRLRLVLGVDVFAGLLLALLATYFVVTDDGLRGEALTVGALGLVVGGLSGFTFRAAARRDGFAKKAAVASGALTVVVGLYFAKLILGLTMILIGVVILVLALLRDDPDPVT